MTRSVSVLPPAGAADSAGDPTGRTDGTQSKRKRRRTDTGAAYLFMSPWLIGVAVFLVGPLLYSVYLSFTDWNFRAEPEWIGLENFQTMLFEDYRFWLSLKITALYLLISVPIYLTMGLLGAVLLNQAVHGIRGFRTMLFLPSVLSGVAVTVIWIQMLNPDSGVVNTILRAIGISDPPSWFLDPDWAVPAMVITNSWAIIGGGAIIYLAGLQNIDPALYESASIDGAGPVRRFFSITLPMLTPTMFFQLIVTVIAAFQIFDSAFTAGRGSDSLLFYLVFMWQAAFRDGQIGYGASLSLVLFLIGAVTVVILMKTSDRWVFDDHVKK